jgi:hypothetical protein
MAPSLRTFKATVQHNEQHKAEIKELYAEKGGYKKK